MIHLRLIRSSLFICNCCVRQNNPSVKNHQQHHQYASHNLHFWLKQIVLDIPFYMYPNFYGPIAHFFWPGGTVFTKHPEFFSMSGFFINLFLKKLSKKIVGGNFLPPHWPWKGWGNKKKQLVTWKRVKYTFMIKCSKFY